METGHATPGSLHCRDGRHPRRPLQPASDNVEPARPVPLPAMVQQWGGIQAGIDHIFLVAAAGKDCRWLFPGRSAGYQTHPHGDGQVPATPHEDSGQTAPSDAATVPAIGPIV